MRRRFLRFAAGTVAWALLCGHSPYRQWIVYRETHLVILTSRDDPGADDLGERIAAVVRRALPDSKAAVGRGPHVRRIASLISSGQASVAVLSRANALAMYHGHGPFQSYGAIALRVLAQNGAYRLVCRDDFPPRHGFLVAEALMEDGRELGLSVPRRDTPDARDIPPHAGALAFAKGQTVDLRGTQ